MLRRLKNCQAYAQLETQAREELNTRQTKFIESLQEELRLAKSVLQNPRLRNLMRERLKDYQEVLAQPEAPRPPAHAKSGSWSSRISKGWIRAQDPGTKVWVPRVNRSCDVARSPRRSVEVETDPIFGAVSLPRLP